MVGQAADLGTFVAVAAEADEGRSLSGGQWVLSGFGELEIGINRDENRNKIEKKSWNLWWLVYLQIIKTYFFFLLLSNEHKFENDR